MKYLIGIIAAFALASCVHVKGADGEDGKPGTSAEYTAINFEIDMDNPRAVPSEADQTRCRDAGGTVRQDGLLGAYVCTQTYPDAGKPCRDNAECIGGCRNTSEAAYGETAKGQCQITDSPFGCYSTVTNGRADPTLCVD